MSRLMDGKVLVVHPKLAEKVGLNEAIVLQQIHYWTAKKLNLKEGQYWVYNTYNDWKEQFPFWSVRTIRRIFKKLEELGYLIRGRFNKTSYDRTSWYRIDYDVLEEKTNLEIKSSNPFEEEEKMTSSPSRSGQIGQLERSNWPFEEDKLDTPIPYTTQIESTDNNHLVKSDEVKNIIQLIKKTVVPKLRGDEIKEIEHYVELYGAEEVRVAVDRTASCGGRSWKYIKRVVEGGINRNIKRARRIEKLPSWFYEAEDNRSDFDVASKDLERRKKRLKKLFSMPPNERRKRRTVVSLGEQNCPSSSNPSIKEG